MKSSITKLVSVILQRLQDRTGPHTSESGIRRWLQGEGYAKRDIDAAMNLVRPRLEEESHDAAGSRFSLRHLTDYERCRMTPEAQAAWTRLDLYGLLDVQEREAVLERLDHFEGPIGLPELDYLVSWVAGSVRDVEQQRTINVALGGEDHSIH